MTEIEKLFENAGIKCLHPSGFCKHIGATCEVCKRHKYPPFTAEKQLEITKFLLKKAVYYDVKDDKYWFFWEDCESVGYKPFDEAIAHFVNILWQDLTDQEKEEIRNILK